LNKRQYKKKSLLQIFLDTSRIASFKITSRQYIPITLGVRQQANLLPKTLRLPPPKQSKPAETKKSHVNPNLDYDLVEYLKKLRPNIYVYDLLKFPFLLQKMLQNITENGKNGNSNSSKVVQNKVPQNTSAKNYPDPRDKGSLPVSNVNNVNNVDKAALETCE
jgi:hypothetical protein